MTNVSSRMKHFVTDVLVSEDRVPEEGEKIVRLVCGRGNNLHEVEEIGSGERYLVSMPSRFRKTVWVKRGDCLIIKSIEEGIKVKGEISEILSKERINFLKREGVWPIEDMNEENVPEDLPGNPNHNRAVYIDSDSSD